MRFNSVPRKQARESLFYSVAEVAAIFGLSSMTVYRAIADGEFPAVKVRGRVIIPAKAVEQMIEVLCLCTAFVLSCAALGLFFSTLINRAYATPADIRRRLIDIYQVGVSGR